jgi:VCBS repeat-containing protein
VKPTIATVAGDDVINANEQPNTTLTGAAEKDSAVALTIGGNVRTVTTDAQGTWTYTLIAQDIAALGQGAKTLTVRATDAAGNTSEAATHSITVDTAVPDAPAISTVAGDDRINATEKATAAITGAAEANATLRLTIAGNTHTFAANAQAQWPYALTGDDLAAMGEGAETLTVTATDAAGNTSAQGSHTITVDTAAPMLGAALPAIASTAGDSAGETIVLTLSFDGPVDGLTAGSDNSVFKVGGLGVPATWGGTDGDATRTLTYTIQAGQNGQAVIDEAALKAALVAGLKDNAGNAFAHTGDIAAIDVPPLPLIPLLLRRPSRRRLPLLRVRQLPPAHAKVRGWHY